MVKIFIDCGTNTGEGFKQVATKFSINSDWIVELFEPNPLFVPGDYGIAYTKFHHKAVWDRNGTVPLSIMPENNEGSSVNRLMDAGLCADPNSKSYRLHQNIIDVECVDISEVINQYNNDDFIVIKIDTEGSEFTIVRKMIKDGTIKKINHLLIEWHTPFLSSENDRTECELKDSIRNAGVNLHNWH